MLFNFRCVQSLIITTFVFSKAPRLTRAFASISRSTNSGNSHQLLHQPSTNNFIHFRGGGIGGRSRSSFLSSSASVNGESNNSSEETGEGGVKGKSKKNTKTSSQEGQTGWNHNPPKQSSKFWETTGEPNLSSTSGGEEKPRTGWLHNSNSAKAKAATSVSAEGDSESSPPKESVAQKMLRMAKITQKKNHRIISPPTFHPCGEGRRAVVTEHKISIPLNRYDVPPEGTDTSISEEPMIDVYFTIVDLVSTPEEEAFFQSIQQSGDPTLMTSAARVREQQRRAQAYNAFTAMKDASKCILYLQGGPGFGAPSPVNGIGLGDKSSWVGAALGKGFKRAVLMDQRGTGRSSTITKQTLQKQFPDLFALDDLSPTVITNKISSGASVEEELKQFDESHPELAKKFRSTLDEATTYMAHFRADNIVKDAEYIKDALLLPLDDDVEVGDGEDDAEDDTPTPRPWGAALGQSFGGFCMMSYISLIPSPPKVCLLTGGIAPMLTPVDDVYAALRERVKERNLKYYDRYPGDIASVKRIARRLLKEPAKLPSGGILTARRFLQVGIGLGGSPSAFASLHSLFSSAFISEEDDDLSRSFLKNIDTLQPWDDAPIYYLLHESIYADASLSEMAKRTEWSAHRAYEPTPEFDCAVSSSTGENGSGEPTLLFGEVVFPWMADGDYAELSGLGMRAISHSLSDKDDWGALYDVPQMKRALATDGTGSSKMAAAVYYDDMYVDFNACMKVTQRGGPLENAKVWITNDFQHSGLRDDGAAIFGKLLGMANGEVGTPS